MSGLMLSGGTWQDQKVANTHVIDSRILMFFVGVDLISVIYLVSIG
jgi:hypothetical protein